MQKALCAILAIALGCGAATAAEPTIDTVAGGGPSTNGTGDGGPAKQAFLSFPTDVAVDASGNLYIAEACRIRKVNTSGIISTFAGNGNGGAAPASGAKATSGAICSDAVAVDPFGNVWFSYQFRIGKIAPTGAVTYMAGTGLQGFAGDGGPAMSAKFDVIKDIAFDAVGNAYVADNYRVRKIATNGIVTTFAGNGTDGEAGDYGPATAAQVDPTDLAVDRNGNVFIVSYSRKNVRKVSPTGMITRVFGGWPWYRSDPVASITDGYYPTGVATDAAGNVFVSNLANLVSMVSANGALTHIVGVFNDTTFEEGGYGAPRGFGGDGGPAAVATLNDAEAIATDSAGNLYILDAGNQRIRKVTGTFAIPTLPAGTFTLAHATAQRLESLNQYSVGLVKGDANGDGLDDLFVLTSNWLSSEVYSGDWMLHVYRQNPDGTLGAAVSYPVAHIDWTDVMAIDLNHDRYTDIVMSGNALNVAYAGVYVMLGGPNGMAPPVRYAGIGTATGAFGLQQADMNGDGHMDVIAHLSTGGTGAGTINNEAIYYGNGTGSLVSKKLTPVEGRDQMVVRDLNGDGKPDLLFGWQTPDDSGLSVAYHDGVDNLLPKIDYPAGGKLRAGNFLAAGDFDGNGQLDVVFDIDYNAPDAKLIRWVRTAAGGFAYVGEWATYDLPQTLVAADMNRDGRDDLLVAHQDWSSIGYMQQAKRSDGSYWLDRETKAYAKSGNYAQPHPMVIGDFNHDYCPDVAFLSSNSGLQILYSTLKNCLREMNGAKAPAPPHFGTTGATSSAASNATSSAAQSSDASASAVNASIVNFTRRGWASLAAAPESLRFTAGWLSIGFAVWFGLATGRWWMRRRLAA